MQNVLPSKLGLSTSRFILQGLTWYLTLLRKYSNEETNLKIPFRKQAVSAPGPIWSLFICSDWPLLGSLLTCQPFFSLEITWLEKESFPQITSNIQIYTVRHTNIHQVLHTTFRQDAVPDLAAVGRVRHWGDDMNHPLSSPCIFPMLFHSPAQSLEWVPSGLCKRTCQLGQISVASRESHSSLRVSPGFTPQS